MMPVLFLQKRFHIPYGVDQTFVEGYVRFPVEQLASSGDVGCFVTGIVVQWRQVYDF